MSEYQEVYNTLLSVKNDKKTGKVYIYGKEKNLSHSGIITVSEGEICSVSYLQKPADIALAELLSLDFTAVMFVPYDSVGTHKSNLDSLNISNALHQLQTHNDNDARKSTVQELNLKNEVQLLLEEFYGTGVSKRIDEIATHLSPQEKPKEFLDKCKDLATIMLGRGKADKMFESLYEKIR